MTRIEQRRVMAGWGLGLLMGLSACATPELPGPTLPPTTVNLKLDGRLPQPERAPSPLVQSGLAVDAGTGLLHYEAGYALQPSALFGTSSALSPNSLPSHLGRQFLRQALDWRVTDVIGAPVELGLIYQQQGDWLETGLMQSEAQRAVDVRWAPDFGQFDVQWTGSGAGAGPLHCPLEAGLRLPLPSTTHLNLRGRDCTLNLPGSDASTETAPLARSWSAALEWGRVGNPSTALRLTTIAPESPSLLDDLLLREAYEVRLMRRLPYRGWEARTALNWRAVPGLNLDTPWSADASLRRQLAGIGVSASLRTGVDPYWFVPDTVETRNQYELGLDLSRWLSQRLPGEQVRMGLAYQLNTYPDRMDAEAYDNRLRWDFSLRW